MSGFIKPIVAHPSYVADMDALIEQFRSAEAPLRQVIEAVPADRWDSQSPCDEWSAREVVGHLIDAQRQHLLRHGSTLPDPPDVGADPATAWREHVAAVEPLISDDSVMATGFDGHFGPTTVGETLQRFYLFDMVAHRWDLATATGQETSFTDAEMDQMETGMDGFGEAL
jgi:uncharacterized protein (TIGR03086 family)